MSRPVRRFNASCPDCGRWRCACHDDGEAAPAVRVVHEDLRPWIPEDVRACPPPAHIRARLAELRESFARRVR